MQGGFFVLLRFFLRVDGVLVRINDTRIYHKVLHVQLVGNFLLEQMVINITLSMWEDCKAGVFWNEIHK